MAGTAVKVKATRTTKSKLSTGAYGKGTRKTHTKEFGVINAMELLMLILKKTRKEILLKTDE